MMSVWVNMMLLWVSMTAGTAYRCLSTATVLNSIISVNQTWQLKLVSSILIYVPKCNYIRNRKARLYDYCSMCKHCEHYILSIEVDSHILWLSSHYFESIIVPSILMCYYMYSTQNFCLYLTAVITKLDFNTKIWALVWCISMQQWRKFCILEGCLWGLQILLRGHPQFCRWCVGWQGRSPGIGLIP